MNNSKKRDRAESDQVSPPHKMTKGGQQFGAQPSNSDLMARLDGLMSSNTEMISSKRLKPSRKRWTDSPSKISLMRPS